MRKVGENPFRLDSLRPSIPFKDYAYNEIRYHALTAMRPSEAEELLKMAQAVVTEKYQTYEQLAGLDGGSFHPPSEAVG
jgi:pyruvate-ferredoxin/flavodoxin oxidoreductase